jgi:hypothetical protein
MLDGEAELQADVVAQEGRRQFQSSEDQQPEWDGNEALQPGSRRDARGQASDSCADAEADEKGQGEDEPRGFAEVESGAPVTEGDGLGELVGRECAERLYRAAEEECAARD